MPKSRKTRRPGLKTRRHRGGELTLLNTYKFNEDAFNNIKNEFLELTVIDLRYLRSDIFFNDIKNKIQNICSDKLFLEDFDGFLNSYYEIEEERREAILHNDETQELILERKGIVIMEIAMIVLLGDTINEFRVEDIEKDVRRIVVNYLLSLREINMARVKQRQNAYIGLQGQGGLPANVAREVAKFF